MYTPTTSGYPSGVRVGSVDVRGGVYMCASVCRCVRVCVGVRCCMQVCVIYFCCAGMLITGVCLRTIPTINIAKDIDQTWSSNIRFVV